MQEASRTDIGRFLGLDRKRNGTELIHTTRTESVIVSLRTWWSTSVKVDIPCSLDPVLWNDEIWKAKEVENCLFTSVVIQMQSKWLVHRMIISVNQLSVWPTHTSHSRTRDFSRVAQGSGLESSSQQESLCPATQSWLTSSTACRTRPPCRFFHTWALPRFPHALQSDLLPDHPPDLRCCPFHTEIYPARVHRKCLSAPWLKRTLMQVKSPTISLKWTIQRSHQCSSTDRAWRRLMIQLRAFRLSFLNRTWMMSKYGTCWLHHCTYRREKQVQTDHEFITPSDKTQCPVHLTSENVQGNLPQCSHTQESRVKRDFPTEKPFPKDINQFKERTKLYLGSLIRKKLWD